MLVTASLFASGQTYVAGSVSYYNGAGTVGSQGMATVEVGRYLAKDFTAGVAVGTTAFEGGDFYAEFRPTFYYQSGKFSQGFTIGAGWVDNKDNPFMTEWGTSTNYQISDSWSVGLGIGGYNFNGKLLASQYTYTGLSVSYTFKQKK